MSFSNIKLPKGSAITRAMAREFAPELFLGFIEEEVKDTSISSFYKFIENDGIWKQMPDNVKSLLMKFRPWDLHWLTVAYCVGAMTKANPTIGSLVASSPELQKQLEGEIQAIKNKLK